MNSTECKHDYEEKINRYCGAYICYDCGDHKGLVRCYCGWSKSGGNGVQELEEMGENIGWELENEGFYDED